MARSTRRVRISMRAARASSGVLLHGVGVGGGGGGRAAAGGFDAVMNAGRAGAAARAGARGTCTGAGDGADAAGVGFAAAAVAAARWRIGNLGVITRQHPTAYCPRKEPTARTVFEGHGLRRGVGAGREANVRQAAGPRRGKRARLRRIRAGLRRHACGAEGAGGVKGGVGRRSTEEVDVVARRTGFAAGAERRRSRVAGFVRRKRAEARSVERAS